MTRNRLHHRADGSSAYGFTLVARWVLLAAGGWPQQHLPPRTPYLERRGATSRPIILLDVGGVMSDPCRRNKCWQRLVGAWFAPRLGGPAWAWREANRIVVERLSDPALANVPAFADFMSFYRYSQREWVRRMCELVGVP